MIDQLPDAATLRYALNEYEAVVARQDVSRLPELDRWYREELPVSITGRAPPYLTRAELVRVTEWKMARGVWRARNLALVRTNTEDDVRQTSTDALARIPHTTDPISLLAKLAGVGPATASAVVAAAAPERYPFFDDIVAAQLPGLGSVKWTLGDYARYAAALTAAARTLGSDWTPALLERALWAHAGGKMSKG
jgi:hypothetical protein